MMQVPKGFIKKHMKSGFECLISCAFVILGCSTVIYETAILAEKYDGDAKYASECVFLSTVLSLFTMPLLYMVLA